MLCSQHTPETHDLRRRLRDGGVEMVVVAPSRRHFFPGATNFPVQSKKRRPDGYCGDWERRWIVKAKELKMNIKRVRKRIDKYMKTHPQYRHLKTVILLGIMMKRYGFSLRGMIKELYYRSG